MSKGLESLVKLMDDVNQCVNSGGIHYIDKRNYDIVEKELKAFEILDNNIEFQFLERKENNKVKYIVRLINFDNPTQLFEWDIEKEQYDLLKEVLL